jgi:plasmid maintenance system antidote protein VapI
MKTTLPDPSKMNNLLDKIIREFNLRNDAALARMLDIAPPVISKLRHGRTELSAAIVVRIHEATELPVSTIKKIAGLPVFVRQ